MRDSLVEVLDSQPLKVPVSSLLQLQLLMYVRKLPDYLCVFICLLSSLPQKFPSREEVGGSS